MSNSPIVISERLFNKAVKQASPPKSFIPSARRVLIEGEAVTNVLDRASEEGEEQYKLLAQLYRNAVAPQMAPALAPGEFEQVLRQYKFIRHWTALGLHLVIVDGYRQIEASALSGVAKQQLSAAVQRFDEVARAMGFNLPSGLEEVHCYLPPKYARLVRELEQSVSRSSSGPPPEVPVFVMLREDLAKIAEEFVEELKNRELQGPG